MIVRSEEAPLASGCEPEWLGRSIADLIRHLSFHYNTPIYKRLLAIGDTADQIRLRAAGLLGRSEHAATAFGLRLSSLVSTLRLVLEAHAWSEGDVVFPAAVAAETHGLASTRFRPDGLNILMDGIRQEHELIRELLASLARTIEEYASAGTVDELEAFVSEVEIASFMIAEQLDLEDRCLWPRVRDLFRRQAVSIHRPAAGVSGQCLQRGDLEVELVDQARKLRGPVGLPRTERDHKTTVVADGSRLARVRAELLPYRIVKQAIVTHDRAHVVQLVGRRHEQRGCRRLGQMRNVVFLPSAPGRLRCEIAVGTALDDVDDRGTESLADERPHARGAERFWRIFDCVVEQGADGFVLVGAEVERDRGHPQQMGDVGRSQPFPSLARVQLRRDDEGRGEPRRDLAPIRWNPIDGFKHFDPRKRVP
jgi:hypothetical protein